MAVPCQRVSHLNPHSDICNPQPTVGTACSPSFDPPSSRAPVRPLKNLDGGLGGSGTSRVGWHPPPPPPLVSWEHKSTKLRRSERLVLAGHGLSSF